MEDIILAEKMAPEAAISRIFFWDCEWKDVKRLVFRKGEATRAKLEGYEWKMRDGLMSFLNFVSQYGVKCVLCAYSLSRTA